MFKNNKKPVYTIGIDARFYGPIGKGLGRYTQEIVDGLLKVDQKNKYVIFLRQENFFDFKTDNPRVKKVLAPVQWYSLFEQLAMPYFIWREKIDLMHFPHFNVPVFCPTKFVVTIHDLILVRYPTARATTLGPITYRIKNIGYRLVIWLAAKRAKCIITVSNFTKQDIIDLFKVRPEKILVTYEGVSKNFEKNINQAQDDKKILLGYNIHKPYLLYVGNVYPHKNLEGLFKVFAKIIEKNNNLQLVLVGKEDYFYQRLKKIASKLKIFEPDKTDSVIFTEYVPDNILRILYEQATLYVFPSFYEGFGLPPLEAMLNNLPVVSSNQASMPEILGNAALYFNPRDEVDMQDKIEKAIKNKELRMDLAKKGQEIIKMYNWSECIDKTLNKYNEILDK